MRFLTIILSVLASIALAACSVGGAADDDAEAEPAPDQPGAESSGAPMTNERLDMLIRRLDEDAEGESGFWRFTFNEQTLLVVTDAAADRMRILAPIGEMQAETADPDLLYRMLQANFDSALDARYALAKGRLWSAFIHPLSSLSERAFLSGVGQTITLADTFGTTFSSGALVFGGGDSSEQIERLFEELYERGGVL